MKIVAIVQARMRSTRLPGKIFANICGYPLIWHVFNRLKKCKSLTDYILATSDNIADDLLETWAKENAISIYRGSEHNVLERYYKAAIYTKADIVVRITADDPFKDPFIIDQVIALLQNKKLDFACNNKPASFPEGLDCEVFTFNALEEMYRCATDTFEQEHVTQHLYRNPQKFKQENLSYHKDISYLRWTIDTDSDLEMAEEIYRNLFNPNDKNIFSLRDILDLLEEKPYIHQINQNVARSAMYSNNINI